MDFAGWRTDIFDNDPKIDKLLEGQGAAGFLVYFFLCQRAYGSQGYYYSWSYDDAATTARKIGGGVGSETVRQTVDLCLRIGLFDDKLFAEDGILTSRGIQKRYALAISERTKRPVIKKYWLLGEDEEAGMISCAQKKSFPPENPGYQGAKPGLSTPKEKERERKEKNSKGESPPRAREQKHKAGMDAGAWVKEAGRRWDAHIAMGDNVRQPGAAACGRRMQEQGYGWSRGNRKKQGLGGKEGWIDGYV